MATMNWERAAWESKRARNFDYSRWFDQLGEYDAVRDAIDAEIEKQRERRKQRYVHSRRTRNGRRTAALGRRR